MDSPLEGVKVWDASWVGVGPLTGRYLGDYGATVVRTESMRNPDLLRNAPPFRDGIPGVNRSQLFADFNTSKLGLGVNLASADGRQIGRRLAEWADVVLESMRPGTFARLGFGYDELREVNPRIILLSTAMLGQTGPRKSFAGYGSFLAPASGFSDITGWPDREPDSPYGAYTDFIAQRFATISALAALEHRRLTGEGQYIDLSQMEASLQLLGTELLDFALNDRIAVRKGNRSDSAAPHGIFPCLPEDDRERWVAIAVESDSQWTALRRALGNPAWAGDSRFATLAGRKQHEDQIEKELATWTAARSADEVVYALQPQVPAGWVHDGRDLHRDAQIAHRGYFTPLQHPVMGETVYEGSQVQMSTTPHKPRTPAPCMGEHCREILTSLLGYSDAEVDALLAAGDVEIVPG
jgi:crotonobetainyl-CoA:carnitine CoA-transferase CaiB-like acyl-CoA transferase